jgi:alkanesulfonate monooxygenase SsuD/methylene tetrahydromethanopterin reductase-like flavin-dependent oxidoreductase (luciferase family)
VKAADEAGFWGYHVAEHHASPLNTVPVPGVWLGAVAQATKRIHLGPLGYLLPLYSPLRLAEEICILDHLSNGRMEVGVGRGVSPFELAYHKIDHSKSREIFEDAYKCLKVALTSDTFSYDSDRYAYKDVPVPLRPLQGPHPAFWYASSNATGSAFAGEEGLHFTTNGPTARAKIVRGAVPPTTNPTMRTSPAVATRPRVETFTKARSAPLVAEESPPVPMLSGTMPAVEATN